MSKPPTPDTRNTGAPQGAAAALLNGLRVLETFTVERPELGVTEIAAKVGLHKSTVHRILTGLAEEGYAERTSSGRYRLGLGIISLAGPLLAGLDVRNTALPHLEDAVDATRETAALLLRDGPHTLVVEQVTSPQFVRHSQNIGTRYHRWGSASVRLNAAHLRPEPRERYLRDGVYTAGPDWSDPAVRDHVDAELRQILENGFSVNDGDSQTQEFGVAAPVLNVDGNLAAIVTLSAPRQRVDPELRELLTTTARQTADTISRHLGYRGDPPDSGRR